MTPSRRAAETAKNERSKAALKIIQDKTTPDTIRKRAERLRRKEAGYKRVECWLPDEDVAWAKQTALDNFYTLDEFLAWCVNAKRVESE